MFLCEYIVNTCDTTPLALEWGLFDMVDTLATSMSSEDHAAVVSILRSLVIMLRNGLFDDVLRNHSHDDHHDGDSSLKYLVEQCDGKIRTKWALLGHVNYYLQYLYAVSPTEAELFADVQELSTKVQQYMKEHSVGDENTNDDSFSKIHDIESDVSSATSSPVELVPVTIPECVLCKYKVSGTRLCRCLKP